MVIYRIDEAQKQVIVVTVRYSPSVLTRFYLTNSAGYSFFCKADLLPKNYGDTKPVEDNDEFLDFMNKKK